MLPLYLISDFFVYILYIFKWFEFSELFPKFYFSSFISQFQCVDGLRCSSYRLWAEIRALPRSVKEKQKILFSCLNQFEYANQMVYEPIFIYYLFDLNDSQDVCRCSACFSCFTIISLLLLFFLSFYKWKFFLFKNAKIFSWRGVFHFLHLAYMFFHLAKSKSTNIMESKCDVLGITLFAEK